jgi:hypothetical protein
MVAVLTNASLSKWHLINYLQNSPHSLETVKQKTRTLDLNQKTQTKQNVAETCGVDEQPR